MQMTVTGRHVDISAAVKEYGREKLEHIVKKHLPGRITKVHVIMSIQRFRHLVEAELHGPRVNIYATATSTDMYSSVDKVLDKVERQLVKYKTKFHKRKHVRPDSIRRTEIAEIDES